METITATTLIFYASLIFIGLFVAGLELAFQWFLMPNMIMYPYAVFLSNLSKKNEIWRHLTRPLGRCRYCNATWIAIYTFFILYGHDIRVLFLIGTTFIWLKIFSAMPAFADIDGNKVDDVRGVTYATATPWQAMMKSYAVLGSFYALVYLIPIVIKSV
jgi:hypothetical protein